MTSYFSRRSLIRKIILFSVIVAGILALFTPTLVAGAQGTPEPCDLFGQDCGTLEASANTEGVVGIIALVINWLTGIGVLIAVLFLILGALRMIVSIGAPEAFKSGRDTAVNAVIGLIVLLLAYTIVSSVVSLIGGL